MSKSINQSNFLLSFFEEPHDTFALVGVNGFILNRYIHGITKEAGVAVYTPESFQNSAVSFDHEEPEQIIVHNGIDTNNIK